MNDFDIVVIGEGEQTMLDIANAYKNKSNLNQIKGVAYKDKSTGGINFTPYRGLINDIDRLPPPSRELFENRHYQNYYNEKFGYKTTAIMTSRGCPFTCDFCSRPIFGNDFRARSAENVADEVEEAILLGYNRIWFADDCFTLNRKRSLRFAKEYIIRSIED